MEHMYWILVMWIVFTLICKQAHDVHLGLAAERAVEDIVPFVVACPMAALCRLFVWQTVAYGINTSSHNIVRLLAERYTFLSMHQFSQSVTWAVSACALLSYLSLQLSHAVYWRKRLVGSCCPIFQSHACHCSWVACALLASWFWPAATTSASPVPRSTERESWRRALRRLLLSSVEALIPAAVLVLGRWIQRSFLVQSSLLQKLSQYRLKRAVAISSVLPGYMIKMSTLLLRQL